MEIKNKTEKELATMLAEKRESIRAIRFGSSGSKVKNVKETKNLKKDIARILTAQNSNSSAK